MSTAFHDQWEVLSKYLKDCAGSAKLDVIEGIENQKERGASLESERPGFQSLLCMEPEGLDCSRACSFPCEMGLMLVPISQSYYED